MLSRLCKHFRKHRDTPGLTGEKIGFQIVYGTPENGFAIFQSQPSRNETFFGGCCWTLRKFCMEKKLVQLLQSFEAH